MRVYYAKIFMNNYSTVLIIILLLWTANRKLSGNVFPKREKKCGI